MAEKPRSNNRPARAFHLRTRPRNNFDNLKETHKRVARVLGLYRRIKRATPLELRGGSLTSQQRMWLDLARKLNLSYRRPDPHPKNWFPSDIPANNNKKAEDAHGANATLPEPKPAGKGPGREGGMRAVAAALKKTKSIFTRGDYDRRYIAVVRPDGSADIKKAPNNYWEDFGLD